MWGLLGSRSCLTNYMNTDLRQGWFGLLSILPQDWLMNTAEQTKSWLWQWVNRAFKPEIYKHLCCSLPLTRTQGHLCLGIPLITIQRQGHVFVVRLSCFHWSWYSAVAEDLPCLTWHSWLNLPIRRSVARVHVSFWQVGSQLSRRPRELKLDSTLLRWKSYSEKLLILVLVSLLYWDLSKGLLIKAKTIKAHTYV